MIKILNYDMLVTSVRRRCLQGNDAVKVYVDGIPESVFRMDVALTRQEVGTYEWQKKRRMLTVDDEAKFKRLLDEGLAALAKKPLVVDDRPLTEIDIADMPTDANVYVLSRTFQSAIREMMEVINSHATAEELAEALITAAAGVSGTMMERRFEEYVRGAEELAERVFSADMLPLLEDRLFMYFPEFIRFLFAVGVLGRTDWVARMKEILKRGEVSCPHLGAGFFAELFEQKRCINLSREPRGEIGDFFAPAEDWAHVESWEGRDVLPFEGRVNKLAAHPEYLVPMLFHHVRNSLYLDDVPRLTKELAVFRKVLGRPLSTFHDGDGNDILWHVFYNQSVFLFPKSDLELVAHKPEFLSCFAAEGCDTERKCQWGFTWDDVWKSIAYRDATLL